MTSRRAVEPRRVGARLRAVRVVFANPALRREQLALALTNSAGFAQLVAVSTYLFGIGGAAGVAAYGVISTLAAAFGVPPVVAVTGRLGHGRLLRLAGLVAAAGSAAMAVAVTSGHRSPWSSAWPPSWASPCRRGGRSPAR